MLIIGCGTLDRGDDRAGFDVARRLRELGIEAQEHSGDGASLLERWADHDAVLLIDAVVTGGEPGTVILWDGRMAPVIGDAFRSSHAFGVAEAVRLARELGRLPERFWICGIEGRRFAPGSDLSPEVRDAIEPLAHRLAHFAKIAETGGQFHSSPSDPAID